MGEFPKVDSSAEGMYFESHGCTFKSRHHAEGVYFQKSWVISKVDTSAEGCIFNFKCRLSCRGCVLSKVMVYFQKSIHMQRECTFKSQGCTLKSTPPISVDVLTMLMGSHAIYFCIRRLSTNLGSQHSGECDRISLGWSMRLVQWHDVFMGSELPPNSDERVSIQHRPEDHPRMRFFIIPAIMKCKGSPPFWR